MGDVNQMDVSIVLVSYNTKDLTRNCINSILEKTNGIEFEIFVVDNNSQDGSAEMIEREFPSVKLIRNFENKGFGAANNIAIRKSSAKYILCLNTDTVLVNNAVKVLFHFMENNPNTAVAGGILFDENMNPGTSYTPFPTIWNSTSIAWICKWLKRKFVKKKETNKVKEVSMIVGADIFFRKSVLDEVGLFDEAFFMYSEEADLCLRIKRAGYNIKFVPDAKIVHFGEKSAKSSWNTLEQRVVSRYIYARKNSPKITLYTMKLSYLILHLICYIFTFDKNHLNMFKTHYFEKKQI